MELTYQQVLAEQYDENAKNLLVHANEVQSDEYVDDYNYRDYEENDLPEKDKFNKFPGARNKPEHVIKPAANPNEKHRDKVRIRNQVVNIDGKFRGGIVPTSPVTCSNTPAENAHPGTDSSYFIYSPARPYKNVTSLKVTSLEFPNTFYTFDYTSRSNTTFSIVAETTPGVYTTYEPIIISDGNYPNIAALVSDIQAKLPASYTIAVGARTNIVSISNSISQIFTLTFPTTTSNPNENGLGYNLGFLKTKYLNASSYTAETVPDVIQDTYVYLAINDYALMETPSFGNTYFNALAKITLPGAKNTVVFDNNYTNSSSKEYHFQQPTNINRFEIRILDGYGNQVNLKGASFSLTIELQEVLDSSIYEKMLEL